ncbi:MAG TPA: hypothetical protein VIC00_07025 [Candidatus Acidoferrales bacterium]
MLKQMLPSKAHKTQSRSAVSGRLRWWPALLFIAALAAALPYVAGPAADVQASADPVARPRLTSDFSGSIPARDIGSLFLSTDLGNVVIHTQNSGKVDYHVHLETDATQKNARQILTEFALKSRETHAGIYLKGRTSSRELSGRLWVTIELNIPKDFSLDISTGGGNILTDDVHGHVSLTTAGGNISTGNIGSSARLITDGGHIIVKNVAGDLVADTGGGHITAGDILGSASLHTVGGHIRVSSIGGRAQLATGGGNVTLEHAGADLVAETVGGQIEVGEAAGIVRAKTGGGGIRVVHLSGPTNLQTDNGSIYLTQVDSPVRASTEAGGITAWFVSGANQHGTCELQSGDGDIVVYLPRELPVTIDAQIQMGNQHRVIVDPAFPLKVSYDNSANGARMVRAEGALNGGGQVLRLRTVAGNIRVLASDADKQIQMYRQQMEELQQQLQFQLRMLEQSEPANQDAP